MYVQKDLPNVQQPIIPVAQWLELVTDGASEVNLTLRHTFKATDHGRQLSCNLVSTAGHFASVNDTVTLNIQRKYELYL